MANVNTDGESHHVSQEEDFSETYAGSLDAQDPLRRMRSEFFIPTKVQLKANTLPEAVIESSEFESQEQSIYLCGNSLGLQPRLAAIRLKQYLTTWKTQGVFGHFKPLEESPLPTWLHADAEAADKVAPIVGGKITEVAVMETLTANLHLLMSAFYRPDINGRHKIILESKAFPSDHYAVESQIKNHALSPSTSMITIEPPSATQSTISTELILSVIAEHATTTALLLLPGIQFYTGQFLDIPKITAVAREAGIFVIWDLAHAVGNVPLQLHDWDVDAAAWCSYKYLNAGPGSIAGLFIHERHSGVSTSIDGKKFVNRLSGWWGSDKESRFAMENKFVPIPGAAGFQLSNPSILDITSLNASLEVFQKAGGLVPLREKSLKLTAYLESLLDRHIRNADLFEIITPREKDQRGAQLSLRLREGLLDIVMKELEDRGVVTDERRPDVVRVAPAPLYNSYSDCYRFVVAFDEALDIARTATEKGLLAEGIKNLEVTS
ncbi:pyridoxal phosphate-dependent transferase [Bisporella sp. PMI_857]|nr:pyridoxal phosphate-dependent transferase [Bisporella sp. PMI_857]